SSSLRHPLPGGRAVRRSRQARREACADELLPYATFARPNAYPLRVIVRTRSPALPGGHQLQRLKWHATRCPSAMSSSGGSISAQISSALQQRVRKRQPLGGLVGVGGS